MHYKTNKMNKIFPIIISVFISALLLTSCDDRTTYAEQLKAERLLIEDYIKRNNIQVITEFPKGKDSWPANVYVKTSSGLYYHLSNPGDTSANADTLESYDQVSVRYLQYTLSTNPDTVFSWNTIDSPYPTTFNFQDYNKANTAWHEALSYMKYNESQAKILVPSKLGFQSNMQSVIPYGYDLKIQFQK